MVKQAQVGCFWSDKCLFYRDKLLSSLRVESGMCYMPLKVMAVEGGGREICEFESDFLPICMEMRTHFVHKELSCLVPILRALPTLVAKLA